MKASINFPKHETTTKSEEDTVGSYVLLNVILWGSNGIKRETIIFVSLQIESWWVEITTIFATSRIAHRGWIDRVVSSGFDGSIINNN